MKKFRVKRLKFNWLTAIALVLVAVTVSAVLVNISDGFDKDFADWSFREVNEDNLYQSLAFAGTNGVLANGEKGVAIDLLENNELKVNGTATATGTYTIGSITLKAGQTYVFDSGLKNGSAGSVYMTVRNASTQAEIVSSYRSAVVIGSMAADTAVTIEITVVNETKVNETLKPILCIGAKAEDAVSFYK